MVVTTDKSRDGVVRSSFSQVNAHRSTEGVGSRLTVVDDVRVHEVVGQGHAIVTFHSERKGRGVTERSGTCL